MLLFLLFHLTTAKTSNNACTQLSDYPVKDMSNNCYLNPNVWSFTPEIVKQHGYQVVTYNVTTPDGYNLQMFRIVGTKGPVFLDHGLFHDSSVWTVFGNKSLAFNLAQRGYDVWLANNRGTRYSRSGSKNSEDFEYWLYSMDAVAANDVPTFLETIVNVTGEKIVYVGHSRGSTLAFMFAAENPRLAQEYLKGLVALCPIVYFDMVWYMDKIMSLVPSIGKILLGFKISALFYYEDLVFYIQYKFCSQFPYLCKLMIFVSSGITWQFLPEDLLVYYTHAPSSESVMLVVHYAQMAISGRFQKFDYGWKGNLARYGQKEPPLYSLANITLPVFMFYGLNDIFIKNYSVQKIFDELGSRTKKFWKIPVGVQEEEFQFSHNDFLWAEYLQTFLYPLLFKVIDKELT